MNISSLNQVITIEKQQAEKDFIGNRTNSWEFYHKCHAQVSVSTGKQSDESNIVGVTTEHPVYTFTVRYSNILSAISTAGYRVIFNGGIYNIAIIDYLKFQNKVIRIKCRKEDR